MFKIHLNENRLEDIQTYLKAFHLSLVNHRPAQKRKHEREQHDSINNFTLFE